MLTAIVLFPILDVKWDRKMNIKYEQKRQKRYKQYLQKKAVSINEIKQSQKDILYKTYLNVDECAKIILKKEPRLWERKIEDDEFLSIRIGIGKVPLKVNIVYPQEKFSMVDDNLVLALNNLIDESKSIDNCPVSVSLIKNNISSIISNDEELSHKYLKNLILQLITFQNYEDLKIIFFIDKNNSEYWEYVKMLPHIWNNTKQIRFFADNYNDMNEISSFLLEELMNRTEDNNIDKNYNSFSPYYLIITDNYQLINNLNFISELFKQKINIGFSLLCLSKDVFNLPSSCKTFIELKDKNNGILYNNENDQITQTEIKLEPLYDISFEKIALKLLSIPLKDKKAIAALPSEYSFLEMLNVGNVSQLNILDNWKKNDTTLSLKAPIGIDGDGKTIFFDIHEKYHGPHGLIAGSTGSGKSEFIISYILNLAIN